MTDRDEALTAGLHELADRVTPGAPPVSTLLGRGHRNRRTRAALAGTAAVAGIGAVAVFAATAPGYGAAHSAAAGAPSGSQAAPTGPISLSLAAERTDASPFHFSVAVKSTVPKADGGEVRRASSEGASDPSTGDGYVKSTTDGQTIRIGDTCYSQPVAGAQWLVMPCGDDSNNALAGLTADPAAVLKQLEADGQATHVGRSGTGSGEVDTWKFTITRKAQSTSAGTFLGYTATGTATVGVADGHVHAVDFTIKALATPKPPTVVGVSDVSITFSQYGVPVHVTAPAGATPVQIGTK
ncbi:hypothetical protein [Actinospica robiniae]|uniref:hypothetical protein n=1 Tax=Actinospica robiniae TaxID=304901 RepID=UPI000405706D|nr:hypothetical protein [Actinospica robiniae]